MEAPKEGSQETGCTASPGDNYRQKGRQTKPPNVKGGGALGGRWGLNHVGTVDKVDVRHLGGRTGPFLVTRGLAEHATGHWRLRGDRARGSRLMARGRRRVLLTGGASCHLFFGDAHGISPGASWACMGVVALFGTIPAILKIGVSGARETSLFL